MNNFGLLLIILLLMFTSSQHASSETASKPESDFASQLIALRQEYFSGEESKVDAVIQEGIRKDYGPAWFVYSVRHAFSPQGDHEQERDAVYRSLKNGVDSAAWLLPFAEPHLGGTLAPNSDFSALAINALEANSLPGDMISVILYSNILTDDPSFTANKVRFQDFVRRQLRPAVQRGSPLALSYILNNDTLSPATIRQACRILTSVAGAVVEKCKKVGTQFVAPSAVVLTNIREFRLALRVQFGTLLEEYEHALCPDTPEQLLQEATCADLLISALSICSIRSNHPEFVSTNDLLVCRRSDVVSIGNALSEYFLVSLGLPRKELK